MSDTIEVSKERFEQLVQTVEQQGEQQGKLIETVEQQAETIEQQGETIEELESELADYRDHNERDKAKIRQNVSEVKETIEEIEERADPSEPAELDPEAPPLYNLIRTPSEQLTPTRRRAKDVWKNITEYATTIPKGETITGPELRRVLSAIEPDDGARIKSEHARRVMEELQAQTRGAVTVSKDGDGRLQMLAPKDWEEKAREAYYDHPDHARNDEQEPAASHSVVRGD